MPRNLEVKARIGSIERAISVARSIHAQPDAELEQTDTYFRVTHGRLKLREVGPHRAELIYYRRMEASARRISDFEICAIQDPSCLKDLLRSANGIQAVVRKRRRVFLLDGSRIHIDEVEDLGSFLEFEVPVVSSEEEAHRKLAFLIEKFDVRETDFYRGSYVDLIEGTRATVGA